MKKTILVFALILLVLLAKSQFYITPQLGYSKSFVEKFDAGYKYKSSCVFVSMLGSLSRRADIPMAITSINYGYTFNGRVQPYIGYGTRGLSGGVNKYFSSNDHTGIVLSAGFSGDYFYGSIGVSTLEFKNRSKLEINWLVTGLQFIAGASDGIREQVLYHPNELFAQYPNLNRQWWDSRISWTNKNHMSPLLVSFSDANHFFKSVYTYADIASIVLTTDEAIHFKFKSWNSWKWLARKVIPPLLARKAGFYITYNKIFKN